MKMCNKGTLKKVLPNFLTYPKLLNKSEKVNNYQITLLSNLVPYLSVTTSCHDQRTIG